MIGKLIGKVDSCFDDHMIIDVNGVGYIVYCSSKTLVGFLPDQKVSLLIQTHVREDHIHLYGFSSDLEKNFFNLLQTVNGIGSRLALVMLSYLSPEQIQTAIYRQDKDVFKKVSGVGQKLAERIIIELKDKISSENSYVVTTNNSGAISDAIAALINLGISKTEAHNLLSKVLADHPELPTADLITHALRSRNS